MCVKCFQICLMTVSQAATYRSCKFVLSYNHPPNMYLVIFIKQPIAFGAAVATIDGTCVAFGNWENFCPQTMRSNKSLRRFNKKKNIWTYVHKKYEYFFVTNIRNIVNWSILQTILTSINCYPCHNTCTNVYIYKDCRD